MNILQINASLFADGGKSSQLSDWLVERFEERLDERVSQSPSVEVRKRELAAQPIPHLSALEFQANITPRQERSSAQNELAALSDELVDELKAADMIVLGVPMYNFAIPSTLKAWIDRVARAGETFRYTEKGPQGLLAGKRVIVCAARGGIYQGSEKDTQTPYLKTFFNFLGIEQVEFVYAEALNMGQQTAEEILQQAKASLTPLIAEYSPSRHLVAETATS